MICHQEITGETETKQRPSPWILPMFSRYSVCSECLVKPFVNERISKWGVVLLIVLLVFLLFLILVAVICVKFMEQNGEIPVVATGSAEKREAGESKTRSNE